MTTVAKRGLAPLALVDEQLVDGEHDEEVENADEVDDEDDCDNDGTSLFT